MFGPCGCHTPINTVSRTRGQTPPKWEGYMLLGGSLAYTPSPYHDLLGSQVQSSCIVFYHDI